MTATLTPEQMAEVIRGVTLSAKAEVIKRLNEDYDLLSASQVCGMLDITANTLMKLPLSRYPLIPGKIVRYKRSEIAAYLEKIRE